MAFSKYKQKKYIKEHAIFCPYCGADGLSAGTILNADDIYSWSIVHCNECHKTWLEEYKLVNIIDLPLIDEEGDGCMISHIKYIIMKDKECRDNNTKPQCYKQENEDIVCAACSFRNDCERSRR